MIKVLVHYKQWVDSGNVYFNDALEDRSKIVEVKDVLELNDMFRHITKIEVINNLTIPVVVVSEAEFLCDVENETKCKDPCPKRTGVCRNCGGQSN